MDILAIEDAITELENSDTTFDNVHELACLYIVKEHIKPTNAAMITGLNNEVNDILPYYNKYIDIKRRYQTNQTSESEVIKGIKDVCKELKEFIEQLYCSTDMNKERICIRQMITELYKNKACE